MLSTSPWLLFLFDKCYLWTVIKWERVIEGPRDAPPPPQKKKSFTLIANLSMVGEVTRQSPSMTPELSYQFPGQHWSPPLALTQDLQRIDTFLRFLSAKHFVKQVLL